MTPKQQELVRTTFAQVHAQQDKLADLLYQELFRKEPKASALFRGDMKEQQGKLLRMLTVAVEHIDNPEELKPMLQNLGMIHHSFGIEAHHFTSFGDALIVALKQILGPACTPEVEESWMKAYNYFAQMMRNYPHHDESVQLPHH